MQSKSVDSHKSFLRRYQDPLNQDLKLSISDNFENEISTTSQTLTAKNSNQNPSDYSRYGCFGFICKYFKKNKFGTWDGVFLSCALSMFGVIMFLRMGYIVGQAGIWQTWIIEILSTVIVLITVMSMSALCSNGEIKHGGAYYMISRSLGPAIGGSIGILFTIGNSIAVAMHILGFVETMTWQIGRPLLNTYENDMRLFGIALLVVLLIFAFVGVGWVIKIQFVIALVIISTLFCFFLGTFIVENEEFFIVGFNNQAFMKNFNSEYTNAANFLLIFGIFFPAMTGIMAGANLSGDLENPSKNIPTGTITAVGVSAIVYILISTFLGSTVLRGPTCDLSNDTKGICYNLIMEKISVPGEILYAGIYAATLSSALAAFVGAPRILMTVAKDSIIKILTFFGHTRKNGEPSFAYIPVFIVSVGFICIANLNSIAEFVTITYLMTYSLINAACFQSSISRSPGWRPTFKLYNKWIALVGALICLTLMFIINYIIAIPMFCLAIIIYLFIFWKKPKVNWGSANEGVAMVTIIKQIALQRLSEDHIKNYRPNVLILTDSIKNDEKIINLIQTLREGHGANFLGVISGKNEGLKGDPDFYEPQAFEKHTKTVFFRKNLHFDDYYKGCSILVRTVGIGRIKPNIIFIKVPENWRLNLKKTTGFFELLSDAFKENHGVMMGLNLENLDFQTADPFGSIDVWWLYDDGGLSILIPYIISKSLFWKKNTEGPILTTKLRLFVINRDDVEAEKLQTLLKLVRLEGLEFNSVYPKTEQGIHKRWKDVSKLIKENSKKKKVPTATLR